MREDIEVFEQDSRKEQALLQELIDRERLARFGWLLKDSYFVLPLGLSLRAFIAKALLVKVVLKRLHEFLFQRLTLV